MSSSFNGVHSSFSEFTIDNTATPPSIKIKVKQTSAFKRIIYFKASTALNSKSDSTKLTIVVCGNERIVFKQGKGPGFEEEYQKGQSSNSVTIIASDLINSNFMIRDSDSSACVIKKVSLWIDQSCTSTEITNS